MSQSRPQPYLCKRNYVDLLLCFDVKEGQRNKRLTHFYICNISYDLYKEKGVCNVCFFWELSEEYQRRHLQGRENRGDNLAVSLNSILTLDSLDQSPQGDTIVGISGDNEILPQIKSSLCHLMLFFCSVAPFWRERRTNIQTLMHQNLLSTNKLTKFFLFQFSENCSHLSPAGTISWTLFTTDSNAVKVGLRPYHPSKNLKKHKLFHYAII